MAVRYQICQRCVMDTSDPGIRFDAQGICHHCTGYFARAAEILIPPDQRAERLQQLVATIRRAGRNQPYDCLIGVSGGVDSSYLAWQVRELGLRPLAVHFDNGWNSALAVTNIQKLLEKLDIDLYTYVVDWDEFRDLQVAFLKASTPDSEIPTDHAISATLWSVARQHRIRYIISGSNFATEAILPVAWSYGIRDWRYIRAIHGQFGTRPLKTFPHFTLTQLAAYKLLYGQRSIPLLNYLPYRKDDAIGELQRRFGWTYYGGKHYESVYTRFYQGYMLPRKFGFDKRRAHLSTLICSGETTRDAALVELAADPYPPAMRKEDLEFVLKKLELSASQFDELMALPCRTFWDYPSYERLPGYASLRTLYRWPRRSRVPATPRDSRHSGDGITEAARAA